ncbi:MAG TPA: GNAT family N-acetyltransferase [Casimicrobiaceae bacterium]|nr:GNAT family N-acetyltransferase [Casimicrobiaceae bacterium]
MTTKVQVRIRPVRCEAFAAEADATATMYLASRRALMPGVRNPHTEAETRAWMRDVVFTRHSVRLAEVDGDVVGFASRDGVWLANLYVKPGWTGHGIGTQLLRSMLANAAGSTPVLRVSTFARNEKARRFLERRGFRAVGSGDGSANEEHEPDLRYERSTREPA